MDAPISVKCFLEQIKTKLEPTFFSVCVVGEVSNFRGLGRHWYFTLKEEGAAIQCAVWASQKRLIGCPIEDGKRLHVKGSLSLYVAGGTLTLVVTHCTPAGIGDFRARLLQLESELRAMGLFNRPKKAIPRFPRRIGIIAAIGGAALWDVIRVTGRRAPGVHLLVFPAAAQGDRAVPENFSALQEVQDQFWQCDVILMVRGGGSLEDLWAYNDPILVKAVADCRLPIVTGVGHEIDFTLVDLAADLRAATPSQAAELVTPDRLQIINELRRLQEALLNRISWRLQMLETTLNFLVDSKGMRSISERMGYSLKLIDKLNHDLMRCKFCPNHENRLRTLIQNLHLAHPQRRLDLAIGCLNIIRQRLVHIAVLLVKEDRVYKLNRVVSTLYAAMTNILNTTIRSIDVVHSRLQSINPNRPLELGFALVVDTNGRLFTRSHSTALTDKVEIRWLDGNRSATLTD
jgi:exodeoxyribonuclease VII large subunit